MATKKLLKWTSKISEDQDNKDNLYLRLMDDKEYGDVDLIVCDYKGEKISAGVLLTVDNKYKCIVIHPSVNQEVPLKTDLEGHVFYKSRKEMRDLVTKKDTTIPLGTCDQMPDFLREILLKAIKSKADQHEKESE